MESICRRVMVSSISSLTSNHKPMRLFWGQTVSILLNQYYHSFHSTFADS